MFLCIGYIHPKCSSYYIFIFILESFPHQRGFDYEPFLLYFLLYLPDVLCHPTDGIWMQWIPFEAMTDQFIRRSPLSRKVNCQKICTWPPLSFHYHPYHYPTDVTDMTFRASDHQLETRSRAGSVSTLAETDSMHSRTEGFLQPKKKKNIINFSFH